MIDFDINLPTASNEIFKIKKKSIIIISDCNVNWTKKVKSQIWKLYQLVRFCFIDQNTMCTTACWKSKFEFKYHGRTTEKLIAFFVTAKVLIENCSLMLKSLGKLLLNFNWEGLKVIGTRIGLFKKPQ